MVAVITVKIVKIHKLNTHCSKYNNSKIYLLCMAVAAAAAAAVTMTTLKNRKNLKSKYSMMNIRNSKIYLLSIVTTTVTVAVKNSKIL